MEDTWYITYEETHLLKTKPDINKLCFILQLKHFKTTGRFPNTLSDVSQPCIDFLCTQLDLSSDILSSYDWEGRSARRHRKEILLHLAIKKPTQKHRIAFRSWLVCSIFSRGTPKDTVEDIATKWFFERKLLCPPLKVLLRDISRAYSKFETILFEKIAARLEPATMEMFERCLETAPGENGSFSWLRCDPGRVGLSTVLNELEKLALIQGCGLSFDQIGAVHPKIRDRLYKRVACESAWEVRRHPPKIRYTLMSVFLYSRQQKIIDDLVDLFILLIGKISKRAEKKVEAILVKEIKRVYGKATLLARIAQAALKNPKGPVDKVVYPIADKGKLSDIVKEYNYSGKSFKKQVYQLVRSSYSRHYRRMVPKILGSLKFRSNNTVHTPILNAIDWLLNNPITNSTFSMEGPAPIAGITMPGFLGMVEGADKPHIERIDYEIAVLQALRKRLRCKEIWVEGADRYRNADQDLPKDFNMNRHFYYDRLGAENDASQFSKGLKQEMKKALEMLNMEMPSNKYVRFRHSGNKNIILTPLEPLTDPLNINVLKGQIQSRWPMTSLLEILREAESRSGFTKSFKSIKTSERLSRGQLRKRLLLVLYGLGTNTGLKRLASGNQISYKELRHVKNAYIHKDSLRKAIREVTNGIFSIKDTKIWGTATTACASDSKKFGSWDQNLMAEWHIRYGGRGVMIYWHVDKRSTCIYSQLKKCSSSEVASMIEGVLRHCTNMKVEKQYVDTHGQSEVAFAFCRLLGFDLMPRLKNISSQKLYLPDISIKKQLNNLLPILSRTIKWGIIETQYDEMIKYACALEQGTAQPESILKRFTRGNQSHPTYRALQELGKVIKTLFLCRYLAQEKVRREIHEGLNVIENWNSANSFIFFGKSGEVSSNRLEEQELSVLALHLLQNSLVYINTLMIQRIVCDNDWLDKFSKEDYRALSPLIHAHVNPYGKFELDMEKTLDLTV